MAQDQIPPPDLSTVLSPLLPALPAAALSTTPPDSILQLLSPILRQRVQLLSASAVAETPVPQPSSSSSSAQTQQQQTASQDDAWIRLLCYDRSLGPKLQATAQSSALELHPVSGEVEIDWDYDSEIRFRRLDEETLQCLVVVARMGLAFRLVYCTEGWRVGEVTIIKQDDGDLFSVFGFSSGQLYKSLKEAEYHFKQPKASAKSANTAATGKTTQQDDQQQGDDDDDDDDYWAQYDAAASTQATPQPQQQNSRNAASVSTSNNQQSFTNNNDDDDDYYAQYDTVQPAMDDHDPDEQVTGESTLGGGSLTKQYPQQDQPGELPSLMTEARDLQPAITSPEPEVVQPSPSRPDSSASSTTSVQKLEAVAQRLEQSEFGVKQHISRSMKSLYMLARASGVERQEFDRLVRIELEMLPMMDETD